MGFEDSIPHNQIEEPTSTEKNPQTYGLSFEEALKSTADIWESRLKKEGYPGNASHAAQCMSETIRGIRFLYDELIRRGDISKKQVMPRIDFDNQPGFSIFFFKPANTIIVSWDYLRQFEGHDLLTVFERKGKYEGTTVFQGKINEFLFLKGVEELTHALDTEILEVFSPTDPNIGQIEYYSQGHEYKALKWQIRAARMNDFSGDAINSLTGLLQKVTENRRTKAQ